MNNIDVLKNNNVDLDHALSLLGDIEMYNEIVGEFVELYDERLTKLAKYKINEDMPNYAILVHALKSDCNYLGCLKLSEMALKHELESKNNNKKYIEDNYDKLIDEYKRVVGLFKEYKN